jgi:predicted enzyme related to lactoylglutathione lyase
VFELPAQTGATHLSLASDNYARAGANSLPTSRPDMYPHWLNFFRVDDAVGMTAKAVALGGRVLVEPRVERDGGKVALVADPQGAAFGLLEARPMALGPLFSRWFDPIEVTRPHHGPASVFAAARGIFGVDAIGPDVPVSIPPPRSVAFGLGRKHERPVRGRTAHVNCDNPVLVDPKLPPFFPFAVPTGNADTLYLAIPPGQHFLDRATAGGAPDRVTLSRRCRRVMPYAQPEIELVVGRPGARGPRRFPIKQGAKQHGQQWAHRGCLIGYM